MPPLIRSFYPSHVSALPCVRHCAKGYGTHCGRSNKWKCITVKVATEEKGGDGEGGFQARDRSEESASVRVAVVTRKRAWDPGLQGVRNGSVLGVAGGSGGCSQ